MKKWIAVLMIVLSAAAHSASAQEATRRGEFEPPPAAPVVPETTTPPAGVPAADNPGKETLPPPISEPMPKTPTTPVPATKVSPVPAPAPGSQADCPGACQESCKRGCCAKVRAWLCHHREKTPDCCYRIDHPDAQLYTYFLDYPCRNATITAVGPTTSCACKKPCPWEGCVFGQFLGNGNLCCH